MEQQHDNNELSTFFEKQETQNAVPIDIPRLFSAFKKSILTGLLGFLVLVGCSYFYLRYTKPVYKSSSVLKLEVKSNANVLGITNETAKQNIVGDISGEIELIRSNFILEEVVKKLNLEITYHAKGEILDRELYKATPFYFDSIYGNIPENTQIPFTVNKDNTLNFTFNGKSINVKFDEFYSTNGFNFRIKKNQNKLNDYYNQKCYTTIHSKQSSLSYLKNNLGVRILNSGAHTIEISFSDYTPNKARDIVKAIDDSYLIKTLESKQLAQQQTIDFINDQITVTEKELEKAEIQLENFLKQHKTSDPKSEFSGVIEKMDDLQEEEIQIKIKQNLLADLQIIINSNKELEHYLPVIESMGSNAIITEISNLNKLISEFNKVQQSQKPTTSAYIRKENEVNEVKRNVNSILLQEEALLNKSLATIKSNLADLQNLFYGLPSKETELTRLKRHYSLFEKFYLQLKTKKVEFGIAKAGTVPEFTVLSSASNPTTSISPKTKMIYTVSIILGLFLFLGQAILRYILNTTIMSQLEVENLVKAPLLGALPTYKHEKMEHSKLVVHKRPKSSISEALRAIRTNINFINKNCQTISVTSTISGEGKTFVAINLGGVLAFNKKVLIIDLDMRKPKLHLGFDGNNTVGMSTILMDPSMIKEAINPTEIKNLHYISSGPMPPNPSELILRPEFDKLLEKLKKEYDTIIIDTPPIGLVTDGLLVMQKVDIPLYVVRAGYSKRGFTKNVNKIYSNPQFKKLSVILNSSDSTGEHGYGYGYGYGYYDEDNN